MGMRCWRIWRAGRERLDRPSPRPIPHPLVPAVGEAVVKMIRFKGEEYLFGGESLDEDGFIGTKEAFESGIASYAYYFPSRGVLRHGTAIGTREDIEILGEANVTPNDEALMNVLTHPSWDS